MILNEPLKTSTFTKQLVALKHRSKRGKRHMVASLMLTSMVDMFSLLVIFLLMSFSNSPEVMAISKGLTLPTAVSAAAPVDAPMLTITTDHILLDQKEVGTSAKVLSDPGLLVTPLQELKDRWVKAHAEQEFKGDIHVQADRGLPSSMVSRFIGLVNSQGYDAVHLAVVSGGQK
jgi:biopolymer transport protein ExbD